MKGKSAILKWILLAGFISGILFANFVGKEKLKQAGALSFTQEQEWRYEGEKATESRVSLAEKRAAVWILFFLLGVSSAFFLLYWCMTFWVGFSFGLLSTTAVFSNGVSGGIYVFLAAFPQFILYFIAFYLLYRKRFRQKTTQTTDSVRNIRTRCCSKAQCWRIAQKVLGNLVLFLIFLIGIVLENTLNPLILRCVFALF